MGCIKDVRRPWLDSQNSARKKNAIKTIRIEIYGVFSVRFYYFISGNCVLHKFLVLFCLNELIQVIKSGKSQLIIFITDLCEIKQQNAETN